MLALSGGDPVQSARDHHPLCVPCSTAGGQLQCSRRKRGV